MLEFRTPGFNPYAVKYSPYYDSRIAVASAANYGIVGNGRLFCLGLGPQGVQIEKTYAICPPKHRQYDFVATRLTVASKASIQTTPSMISPGPRSTRTSFLLLAGTDP